MAENLERRIAVLEEQVKLLKRLAEGEGGITKAITIGASNSAVLGVAIEAIVWLGRLMALSGPPRVAEALAKVPGLIGEKLNAEGSAGIVEGVITRLHVNWSQPAGPPRSPAADDPPQG